MDWLFTNESKIVAKMKAQNFPFSETKTSEVLLISTALEKMELKVILRYD